jgi:DNA-binding NarL/FixJ family response regulator
MAKYLMDQDIAAKNKVSISTIQNRISKLALKYNADTPAH